MRFRNDTFLITRFRQKTSPSTLPFSHHCPVHSKPVKNASTDMLCHLYMRAWCEWRQRFWKPSFPQLGRHFLTSPFWKAFLDLCFDRYKYRVDGRRYPSKRMFFQTKTHLWGRGENQSILDAYYTMKKKEFLKKWVQFLPDNLQHRILTTPDHDTTCTFKKIIMG